jgi:branched-chain amino acid transport system permease protein
MQVSTFAKLKHSLPNTRSLRARWVASSRQGKVVVAVVIACYVLTPLFVQSDFTLSMLCTIGIVAVGAIGLNILTGYAGQVSLGHAFFLGVGAYAGAALGDDLGLPFPVWLALTGVIGGLCGAVLGPLALRVRGAYLIILTLGLVYIGAYLFQSMTPISGGLSGRAVSANLSLGPIDFTNLRIFGETYSRNQGMFWLIWGVVLLVSLVAINLVTGRVGRGLRTLKERESIASAVGVPVPSYKLRAFAASSALAAVAGGLWGAYTQYLDPQQWNLDVSIQYIAVIIIGGVGSIWGTVAGAAVVCGTPVIIQRYSESLPFLAPPGGSGEMALTAPIFNQLMYGVLIIGFLLFEPTGLHGTFARLARHIRRISFTSRGFQRRPLDHLAIANNDERKAHEKESVN